MTAASAKSGLIKFNVLNRYSGAVQFTAEIECKPNELPSIKLGLAVRWAVKARANFAGANLARANLADAYLADANLADANLADANLAGAYLARANFAGANLADANLADANLAGANLARANLAGAYLARAYLAGANLADANLADANLARANLAGAHLAGANLAGAHLAGANLAGANLVGAKNAELIIARTRILPEGDLVGWKKCRDNVVVKLWIPYDAKRSHAFGRKCRAEFAKVIEVFGADVGISQHDGKTEYRAGAMIRPDSFDEHWSNECSNGVHFFISRIEAENY
jgi:uncharacterized protein YjbI with pentapeptide repeats